MLETILDFLECDSMKCCPQPRYSLNGSRESKLNFLSRTSCKAFASDSFVFTAKIEITHINADHDIQVNHPRNIAKNNQGVF